MSKSGTIQFNWYYRTATTNKCLGLTTRAFFVCGEKSMFKRIKADPNGNVTFEYGSSTVTIDRDGVSHIKSTIFNQGKYGNLGNIRSSSTKHIFNKLS